MAKTEQTVISDSGPLIHLDELDCVDLILYFDKIIIPYTVFEEVKKYRKNLFDNIPDNLFIIKDIPNHDLNIFFTLYSLQKGEQDCINIAMNFPESIFLTDDSAARLLANQLNIKVHGTIGIILRAIRKELKTKEQVLNILRAIPKKSSLYIKKSLLDDIISEVKNT